VLPIPASINFDSFGLRRVIFISWVTAFLGAILTTQAPTKQFATLILVIASYVGMRLLMEPAELIYGRNEILVGYNSLYV
jgi:hypothetical protein